MRCTACGKENGDAGRFCIHCGAPLSSRTDSSEGANIGRLEEELRSIAFAHGQLESLEAEGVTGPEAVEAMRRDLLAGQRATLEHLVRAAATLPLPRAESLLLGHLQLFPHDAIARLHLGLFYWQSSQVQRAAEQFLLASACDPSWPEPHLKLAQLSQESGNKAQALYEYGAYLQSEPEPRQRDDARSNLIALEGSLFSQQQVISTAERLQYVAAVAERLARQGVPHTTVEGLRDIAAAFSRRAEALRPPPLPAVTSATVAADMVAPARVDQPAAPLAHPPAPPTPPRVPSPPAAAREPFDWASFWSALFSERSLTALLGFGVLLVTVSSLVLLVSVWQTAEGGWEGAWPVVQPLLLGQFFLFLLSGYVIKERMKLHLSGLAVITIAALWVPLNLGAWMFKLFGPQVNQAREAAGGQYLAVPGIGVPLDLPLYAWLIVVLVSAVVWGALTYRFRGHLLAHGTVGFGGAGVALFVALFGMQLKWPLAFGWEWPLASLGALTVPLLLGWRRLRSASFGNIVEPMFWTAQGTLAGVLAVLGALVLTGRASGYPLAAVLASGTGLYLLAHHYARATAYQYAVVAFSVAALLSLAGEIELWKEPYFDALLMLAGLSYLAFGQWRRDPAESMAPRMIGLPLAPSYAAAYALLAAAVVWPPAFGNALHAAVLYGAAGVAFISARWWRHTAWTYLANLLFAAALAATLDLASPAPLPISGWAVAWGALAWVCLAQGRILRGVPGHSPAGFVCAMAASTGSLLWLVIFPDSTTALIALPMTAALFAALAFLVHQGREPALAGMVGRAVQALEGTSKGDSNARGAAAFMGVSIALAATWGAVLVEHLSLRQVFHAYSLLFWACASASASRFRWGNGVYRKVFQGTGAVLGLFSVAMSLSAYESQAASSSGAGQVLPALYGAAALALAFRFLTANPTSLYVAAGFLPVPVALTLQWLGLPGHLWAAPFMALASAYLAPGVFRVLGLQATDARALRQTGIGVSALALAWTLYWMVSVWADRDPGTPGVAERVLAGAAPLAASLWAAVLAYQQRAISWGYAAMALAGVGVAIVVEGLPRYPGSIAFATALGAIAYHSIAWLVRIPRHSAQAATSGAPAEGNAALAFERPATVAGWLLTGASVLLASLELAGAPGPTEAWFTTLTYLGVTAILAASAYVHRAPRFAHGALALLPLPYSLAVASISGTALAGLPLPGTLLAFSWTGLGLFYVAGGFVGEGLIPRYVTSAPWVAYAVLGLAALAGLGDPGRESIVFGAIVAVAVVSAFLSARGASRLVSGAIGQLAHVPEGEARMYAAFGYITVAGILLPLWGLRVLDWAGIAFFDGQSAKGLFLGLAAIPYTALGKWLSRRANGLVAFPLLATGAGLSFLSITMAFPDHGLSVTTLSMAAAHAFLVAYLFRGTILGYVALWAAAALLPLAGARAIQGLDVKDEVYGLFLAGTALLYLGGASLWERRHSKAEWRKEVFVRFLSSMLGEARTGELTSVAVPFHGTAFLLTIAAAVLAWPSPGEPAGIVAIAAFGAVALFYAAASWRWGTSLLLYPGLASASVAYGLSVSYVAPASTGLALLPGSALSLGLGWLAYHWKAGANVSRPTSLWSELTQGRSAVAWAAPLLAAGYAGTIGAVLLSLPDEGPRLATLAFASVASGLSWLQFRGRVWLVALLASAHGTYASAITLDVLGLAPHEMGVLFVPAAAVMGLLVGRNLAKDGTKGSPSALLSPGSLPLTLAGAVDVGLSLVLAAQSDWTGLLVTAAYAGLAAVTAHFTDLPLLAHASSFFAISATTFASRLLGMAWSQSAVVWSAQGLIMWWGSQGARAVTTSSAAQETRGVVRLSIWAAPLRDAGMLLSWAAAVLVASVAAWSLAGAPAFDAGRHILGAPLAEGDSLQSATAALGFLGLLYLGIAFVERRPVFVYLSLGLLLASWTLQMLVFRVSHYQAYAIPAGLYLLTVAFFERRRASSSLATAIEGSGVALLLGSSFWQSAVQDASLAYGLLLAVESILLVLWASANKTRLPFVAGIAAFVVEVFWQTGEWLLGFGPAVIALVAGILIVTSVALVEWKRQQLVALGRQWSSRMTAWRW